MYMVYKLVLVSGDFYGSFFMIVAQLELWLGPLSLRILGVSCPFTENSRTYNSMLCVLLLRILGPYTFVWDLQLQ